MLIDNLEIQCRLPQIWQTLSLHPEVARTVVVVPSMSTEPHKLFRNEEQVHYEERLLTFLTLLSMPKTHVVFLSSLRIPDDVISYYLQFLPGIPFSHARHRLHLISMMDRTGIPLTKKILDRPAVIERIKRTITNPEQSYIEAYRITDLERELSSILNIPIMGSAEDLRYWGSKSGGRELFSSLSVPCAPGFGNIATLRSLASAIVELHNNYPQAKQLIIKLNDGFSGIGNAFYPAHILDNMPCSEKELVNYVADTMAEKVIISKTTWEDYSDVLFTSGGVVEVFLEDEYKTSPTVQLHISPLGEVEIMSTHEQLMGGLNNTDYIGSCMPANSCYTNMLHRYGKIIGSKLAELGAVGPVSLDFLTIRKEQARNKEVHQLTNADFNIYAMEINLRRGGTTHPLHTTRFLTGGRYNVETGKFLLPTGKASCYVTFDSIAPAEAKGLNSEDLIEIITQAGLHYNSTQRRGIIFHMMGSLSEFGKVGATCIASTPEKAWDLYRTCVKTLRKQAVSLEWLDNE